MGSLAVCGRRLASFHKSLAPSCTCSWSWGLLSVCAFRGLEETRVCVTCRSIQAGARFYEMREASLPLVHCVTVPKPTSQVLPCITCQFRAAGVCPLGGLLFHLYNHLCWHTHKSRWCHRGGAWQGCAVGIPGSRMPGPLGTGCLSPSCASAPMGGLAEPRDLHGGEGPVVGAGRDPGGGWPNIYPSRVFKYLV